MTNVPAFLVRIVGHKAARAITRRRMAILLGTLVLLVLARPIDEMTSQGRLVISCATAVFLVACLQQVDAHSRLRIPLRLAMLLWLVLAWSAQPVAIGAATATLALLNLAVLWLVARHLVKADHVDSELLCAAFGAYLLLGSFWAETYEIVALVGPGAFTGPGGSVPNRNALFYFSFTTLTTTGYGDITAVNPLARMWSVFEAITGTMYNATVIARLVSLYGGRVRPDGPL